MDVDPSQDPDLQLSKFFAIASASLGLMSLCLAIIPACGGFASLLGVSLGLFSMRIERSKLAQVGIALSGLGILITIVYAVILLFRQQ